MKHALAMPRRARELTASTAAELDLDFEDLVERRPRYTRAIAHARWLAWSRMRKMRTPAPSLPLIGGWFDVDHTTVLYGLRALEGRAGKAGR